MFCKQQYFWPSLAILGNILPGKGPQFATLNGHLVTKAAREKIGRHLSLQRRRKPWYLQASISLTTFGHLGQHLTKQGATFATLSSHVVTKAAREKLGRHFALADNEKTMVFASINLFDQLWPSWAPSYEARDHV